MAGAGSSSKVVHADGDAAVDAGAGVASAQLVAPIEGSPLALALVQLAAAAATEVTAATNEDLLLFVFAGEGAATVADGERVALRYGTTLLLTGGERVELIASADGLRFAQFAVVHDAADEHALLGERVRTTQLDLADPDSATGSRSFQILLGPEHGCCRATLFVGVVPPGAAPWHFHQYDEIVLILRGHGAYHQIGAPAQELREHSAVRIRPRDVHVNENCSEADMHVLGAFTPSGSPGAAYLAPASGLPPHPTDAL